MAKTSDCNNVDGNCSCKTGWQGATCVEDVNECTDNLTICNTIPNSQCNNMNGSYKCNCVSGYEKLTNGNCQGRLLLPLSLLCHFQQYFSYIVAVSFIGGRNRRTQRKPSTCRKSLTNLIT